MIERADIVREAREWIGTPWRHQASLKGKGTDCIGLIAGVARDLGIAESAQWDNDARRRSYGKQPVPAMLVGAADHYLERVSLAALALGDILLMRFKADPQHFAIVSARDPDYIVHAYASARRVAENRLDDLWRSRIVRAYRFRGVD